MGFIILKEDRDRKIMAETIEFEGLAYFNPKTNRENDPAIEIKPTIFDSIEDAKVVMVTSQLKWPKKKFEIIENESVEKNLE
jgi:hypothetical protein